MQDSSEAAAGLLPGKLTITPQPDPQSPRSPTLSPKSPRERRLKALKQPYRSKTMSSTSSNPASHGTDGDRDGEGEDKYGGATIFNIRDRPDMVKQESYAVGLGKTGTERRSGSFDNRLSWKNFGDNLPRMPSMPPMPEIPSIFPTRTPSKEGRRTDAVIFPRRSRSRDRRRESIVEEGQVADGQEDLSHKAAPLKQKLVDLHAKHPNLMNNMSKPLLPIATFPNQGTGSSSEFNQEAPLWSKQPFKLLYFAYFGLSVGLIFLPWFAISSIFKSQRARKSWSWKRSTLVKLYRHGTRLTFRTYTSLSRDITKEVPHSKTVRAKFVWVAALPDELVKGDVREKMLVQNIKPARTCGFWYGERDGGGGVGQQATAGEKVVYHLHGGAYWIGTAHEKDVTSAVNMQVLRALNMIYESRLPQQARPSPRDTLDSDLPNGRKSPHPPLGGPAHSSHRSGGHCKRAFSLDYRLCVPGRPEMGSYPAALLDALAGYRYLVQECGFEPKNIILAGDSAGGNLALALCRYLRDEQISPVPGAMLLLSPWADTSRSHSGPLSAPNKFSSVYLNRECDIISPSLAFRNTAVSALLGKLPARETYRNPYLSSISLQLPTDRGGTGPDWGFQGFPRRIYVCTGSAELSYDQHLTLAYRLAGGTKDRMPIHSGDRLSVNEDPYEMSARLTYPRPKDHEITLWPSAVNTPAGTPLAFSPSWGENAGEKNQQGLGDDGNHFHKPTLGSRLKSAHGYAPSMTPISRPISRRKSNDTPPMASEGPDGDKRPTQDQSLSPSTNAAAADDTNGFEAGKGPKGSQVKEKDESGAGVTHDSNHDRRHLEEERAQANEEGGEEGKDQPSQSPDHIRQKSSRAEMSHQIKSPANDASNPSNGNSLHNLEQSYFGMGGEDRTVVLDECTDAIHDYTLFDWYEPERGQTWSRIAKWIDEEV